eukprot:TRINITY_DN33368_c0_g3_i2.p1 TRINITY_DN33368_c0_g3~~TRINITY_DN33368_c0_g3_i2.p1  ORF type:complete len:753 (+),score=281.15 TRINITY_DN33368_c0_g3_i2:53-2311(+)
MGNGCTSGTLEDQSEDDMPFWKKDSKKDCETGGKSKEKVNYKARLEHKQYLAQESPEPIYEISDCGLKTVPSGVYSRCKILRKQALLIHDNELTSLNGGGELGDLKELASLDLHNNQLEKLPDDIGKLTNLRNLYLQKNRLKCVPSSLGNLTKLTLLNLAQNNLKDLPDTLASLTSLRTLDLRGNPKLKELGKWLCQLRCLDTLLVDEATVSYPDSSITSQGTEAIMRFLCQESDIQYISPSECLANAHAETNGSKNGDETKDASKYHDPYQDIVSSHLAKAEQIKEQKRQQAILLEKQLNDAQAAEAKLKQQSMEQKKKLLEDLAEEGTKKDEEMKKLQQEKEEERSKWFQKMSQVENMTDVLIKELTASNSRYSDPQKLMEALEQERREMQERLNKQDIKMLKEQEVLRSMQLMMEDELQKEATRRQYEQRQGIVQEALNSTLENDRAVETVLQSKGKQQEQLIGKLLEDEKYQREAFSSLLLQQDSRSQEISEQMDRIQAELASLTVVEMKKRDMKVEFEMEVLKEKRETLTNILLDLIQKKKERAGDLQELLREMESGKEADQENYWLIQYQKLMDMKPDTVVLAEEHLDPKVKRVLSEAGADKYKPLFAKKNITFKELSFADDKILKQYGVESEYLRNQILFCLHQHLTAEADRNAPSAPDQSLDDSMPSAPPPENGHSGEAASAPPDPQQNIIQTFKTGECVVCMERKSNIIFLPCGHMCSCLECEAGLEACPLCRTPITQRVRLN